MAVWVSITVPPLAGHGLWFGLSFILSHPGPPVNRVDR